MTSPLTDKSKSNAAQAPAVTGSSGAMPEGTPAAAPSVDKKQLFAPEERAALIDQLDRSFLVLPRWAKIAVKHAIGAHHPVTGEKFTAFRQVLEAASDYALGMLRDDFQDNNDLLPRE